MMIFWDIAEHISVLVTALATIVLVVVTYVLAKETKRLADVGERPNVIATFEPNKRAIIYLDMIVHNVGTATAYDIEIDFDPPLVINADSNRKPKAPIRRVSLLKPNQSIQTFFVRWSELETKQFNVVASWKRLPESLERETSTYNVDLALLEGLIRLGGDPVVELAQATKKISDEIGGLASGFKKLSVDVFDSADRKIREQELEEFYKENSSSDGSEKA